jgi:hypothetical protein
VELNSYTAEELAEVKDRPSRQTDAPSLQLEKLKG